MIDHVVNVVSAQVTVGTQRVRKDLSTQCNVLADLGAENLAANVWNDLGADSAVTIGAVALQ